MTRMMPQSRSGKMHDNALVRYKIRLRNPETGKWLHMSGEWETDDLTRSWSGFKHQARKLRANHRKTHGDWPYRVADLTTGEVLP